MSDVRQHFWGFETREKKVERIFAGQVVTLYKTIMEKEKMENPHTSCPESLDDMIMQHLRKAWLESLKFERIVHSIKAKGPTGFFNGRYRKSSTCDLQWWRINKNYIHLYTESNIWRRTYFSVLSHHCAISDQRTHAIMLYSVSCLDRIWTKLHNLVFQKRRKKFWHQDNSINREEFYTLEDHLRVGRSAGLFCSRLIRALAQEM